MTPSYAVGLDLGGTYIKSAVVDRGGKILHKLMRPTPAAGDPTKVLAAMDRQVRDTLSEAGLSRDTIIGLGVGSPGPLSSRQGIIHKAANLPGWSNVPVRTELQTRTGFPVVLHNDGNAAAYGEYWAGGGSGDLVLLTLGTGVGGGVILDGKPLEGHFENAAELGHVILCLDGRTCGCGQRGCLEQYASAASVVARFREAISSGETSSVKISPDKPIPSTVSSVAQPPSDVSLRSDFPATDDRDQLSARQVAEAAQAGDQLCLRIWDETCRYIALACVMIQHTFNPAQVLLGGGMSQASDFLLKRVQDHHRTLCWRLYDDAPIIRLASLGNDAGVVGAAGLALRPVPA